MMPCSRGMSRGHFVLRSLCCHHLGAGSWWEGWLDGILDDIVLQMVAAPAPQHMGLEDFQLVSQRYRRLANEVVARAWARDWRAALQMGCRFGNLSELTVEHSPMQLPLQEW